MIRSGGRATRPPAAIFNSNRKVMYRVTRTRNTIRPTTAFLEMVPPHVGPTSCSLMSLTEIPAALARSCRSRSPLKVGTGPPEVGVTGTLALGETAVVGVGDVAADG